jgi:Cu2+-exporting ATPase
VRVPLGQAFPADGRIEGGATSADESLLSGEAAPVAKGSGDEVIGGSVNVGAPAVMRVERAGEDTRWRAIVALMRDAMAARPAAARIADLWAGPFLLAVVALAGLAAALWSLVDPQRAVWVAVAVLIVTCPCALFLAVPATLLAAARGLARRGVLVQRLDAIERLGRVSRLFVDKTGTLTEGAVRLAAVTPRVQGADPNEALATAASLAGWSAHPLARAIAAAAPDAADGHWSEVREVPGQGLQARDAAGREWRMGSPGWATGAAAADGDAGHVILARDGAAIAEFSFAEPLREGASESIADWRRAGVVVTLITGDTERRAQAMARALAVDRVIGSATPETKLAAIADAQAAGAAVAMIGDGVNDAPVLARADVSFAMGQGALAARAQADMVIVSNRPGAAWHARAAAVRALRIVRQNLVASAVYNAACIPLALAGWLPPWAAGLGMATSSLLVVLNAQRAAR